MGIRSEFPHMQNIDIRKQLDERWPKKCFHIVVACWGIPLDHRQHTHCGEHTEIMRACMDSIDLPCLMKQCRKAAFLLWASGHDTVRVMCVCEGGMLKSVAVAALLQAVYRQEGFNSSGPHHLSKCDALPSICWSCTECNPNWKKDVLYSIAQAEFIRAEWLCGCEG